MRGLIRLAVVLLVLAALAVGADRGADAYAEDRVSTALAGTFGTSSRVDVHGFPFLTQWGAGRFDRITLAADRASISGTTVNDLRLTMSDVTTPGYPTAERDVLASTAGSVRMTGTVPYHDLALPAGVTARPVQGRRDRLRLSGAVPFLGHRVKFRAVVRVSVHEGKVDLEPRKVRVLGDFASAATTSLVRDNLTVRVAPPGMPDGTHLTSLAARDDGLWLAASGTDVQVPRS